MKYIFLLFALVFLLHPAIVRAGGSNVLLAPVTIGVAQKKGVDIILTVFDPYKNKLDWPELTKYSFNTSGYDPIGVADLDATLEYISPTANQYCKTTGNGKTDAYGQSKYTCYSDAAGEFVIKTHFTSDRGIYDGGPNAKDAVHTVAIHFTQNVVETPKPKVAIPVPSIKPKEISDVQVKIESDTAAMLQKFEKENEDQKNQIAELMNKVNTQEKKLSALDKIIQQIQSVFAKFFK